MAGRRDKTDLKNEKNRNGASGRKDRKGTSGGSAGGAEGKRGFVREELWSIIAFASGLFMIVSFQTAAAGVLGAFLKTVFLGIFGAVAYIIPYYLVVYAALRFAKKIRDSLHSLLLTISLFLFLMLVNTAGHVSDGMAFPGIKALFDQGVSGDGGGLFGMLIGIGLVKLIGRIGLYILSFTGLLISLLLLINASLFHILSTIANFIKNRRRKRVASKRALTENAPFSISDSDVDDEGEIDEEKKRGGFAAFWRNLRIIDIMKDDSKFDKNDDDEIERGMEEAPPKKPGRGLTEDSPYADKIGLEPKYPIIPGLGLDNYNTDPTGAQHASDNAGGARGAGMSLSWSSKDADDFDAAGSDDEFTETDFMDEDFDDGRANPRSRRTGAGRDTAKRQKQAVYDGTEADHIAALLKNYRLPPSDLLKRGQVRQTTDSNKNLKTLALKLENTLESFNVDAKVVRVVVGPSVTRYEIQPGVGVKVKSIKQLENDIALNLEAKSIRIEAPIPGKAAVGIEVSNERIDLVSLRDIIESDDFQNSQSKITFAVGMDIAGKCVTADLKTMPHLLIAGSTGSGKSVCINCIIMSLLFKSKPDEVRLVLVDPKVVELGNYNGIPHLLVPVVTEPGMAASALNWAVSEMKDRYDKFGSESVRDLGSYNTRVKARGAHELVLPQIVIIIDELADLMMIAPAKVEESICRLAQMARAAGMHLIVATQRPSVDVITGVIKANIPSRISFAVSSQVDSRTILDMSGAEHLMGSGDMLFNPLGRAKPLRIQGAYVSDSEVHSVIDFVKKQMDVDYSESVLNSIESGFGEELDVDDSDDLLPEAIETVVAAKQASASMLQRRFRIGYNRAARLIEIMEARGIVGPADGSRPRNVLMSEEEFVRFKFKENSADDD